MGRVEPGWTKRLAVVATSFKRVGMGRLGSFVIPPEEQPERLRELRDRLGADELVYVATCNRVECYLLMPAPLDAAGEAELVARLRARFPIACDGTFFACSGEEAVRHCCAVTSSLDSLIVGETQIAGQLRRALERCRELGVAGDHLARLIEAGAGCNRKVRAATTLGQTPTSAASIAVKKIKKYFGAEGPAVSLLVGVGEMTRKVARELKDRPGERIFVNRTRAKAEALAAEYGGRAMSLAELKAAPPPEVDFVFAATASTRAVVGPEVLAPALAARRARGCRQSLIVCDLGLPRDVDRRVDALDGVLVVDMERIEQILSANRAAIEHELVRARDVVAAEVARLVREDRFCALADQSAGAMLSERLGHLEETDREAILRFAVGLAARMARQP